MTDNQINHLRLLPDPAQQAFSAFTNWHNHCHDGETHFIYTHYVLYEKITSCLKVGEDDNIGLVIRMSMSHLTHMLDEVGLAVLITAIWGHLEYFDDLDVDNMIVRSGHIPFAHSIPDYLREEWPQLTLLIDRALAQDDFCLFSIINLYD